MQEAICVTKEGFLCKIASNILPRHSFQKSVCEKQCYIVVILIFSAHLSIEQPHVSTYSSDVQWFQECS